MGLSVSSGFLFKSSMCPSLCSIRGAIPPFSNRAPSVKGLFLFLRNSLIWKATATPCPSFRWWNGGRVGRRGQVRSRRRRWPGGPGLRAPAHPIIIVLGMGVLRPWLAEVVSAGHMVLSAVGDIRRNMASGRGRRPDVPNAVIARARRNGGGGIVEPRPGRDGLPLTDRREAALSVPAPSGTRYCHATCGAGRPPACGRRRLWPCARRSAGPGPAPRSSTRMAW